MDASSANHTPTVPAKNWHGVVWLCMAVAMLIAVVILFGRLFDSSMPKQRLPMFGRVGRDLSAIERDGQLKHLSAMRGKVFTCAYLYTVCPHGCAAVMGQMMKLNRAYGDHPDFHQASIAVAPERDSHNFLRSYAEGIGVKPSDHWWFLTGDQKTLWSFMDQGLKLVPAKPIPAEERLNPLDLYEHDLRIVLVDRHGQIRGYYAVFHPQIEVAQLMCEKLQRDVRTLLEHPEL